MVYEGILLSLIVGYIRKGSLKNLAYIKLRHAWIFPVLLVALLLVLFSEKRIPWVHQHSSWLYMGMYVVGMLFLLLNRSQKGFLVILLGVFMNFLVMAVNGGKMPVSMTAIRLSNPHFAEMLTQIKYGKHILMTSATRLKFLGDIIPLARPYYYHDMIVSLGDIVIAVGAFIYIQSVMLQHRKPSEASKTEKVNEQ